MSKTKKEYELEVMKAGYDNTFMLATALEILIDIRDLLKERTEPDATE